MFFVLVVLFLSTFACANERPSTVSVILDSGAQVIGDLAVYNFEGSCQMAITDGELSGTILVFPCRRIALMQQEPSEPEMVEEAIDGSEDLETEEEVVSPIVDLNAMRPAPVNEVDESEVVDEVAVVESTVSPTKSADLARSEKVEVQGDADASAGRTVPVVMADLPDGMRSPASVLGL